ncbi:peptidoglycan DD-metalloendopeptidase family protein [Spiribacter onubensis]|uniref:Peptidoglycan DD-metalloendopeptidase family protein n=2 Tax=Spiribacter onubensis TaxID=3122420 RepID=A0ABV3S887_9GAMM
MLAGCSEFDYASDRHLREAGISAGTPGIHTVRQGDTLYQIAWAYGLDFRDVARWNAIGEPYVIYPGQRLRLRPAAGSGAGTAGAVAPTPDSDSSNRTPAEAEERMPAVARREPLSGPVAWQWPSEGRLVRRYDPGALGKRGIGIAGAPGSPVKAAGAGDVVYSGDGLPGYGNLVIIKHNERFLTAYGYNRELLVEEGDRVRAGETIARMGASGQRPGELHFEVRERGEPVNPVSYLP